MSPLAELKTPEGTLLIQDRRRAPRDGSAPAARPREKSHVAVANSPAMMGLGGLIILGVLVGSYTTKYDAQIGHVGGALPIPSIGFLILQLFLARAAFRLWEDVRSVPTLRDFVLGRAFRYLPAAIPTVLLGFLLLKIFGLRNFRADVADLPANLLLFADMIGVPDIDASHWRIKIEIIQAALVATAWFSSFRRHLPVLLTGALVVTALVMNGEPIRHNVLTLQGLLTNDGYLPFFAFGIALSELTRDRASRLWQTILGVSVLLAAFSNSAIHGPWIVLGLAALSALVFGHLKILGRWRLLNRLGEIAFPVYVVHYVMGFIIIERLERLGCPPVAAILAASSVALLAGHALNVFIEYPLQKRGPATIQATCRRLFALGGPLRLAVRKQSSTLTKLA